MQIFGTNSDAAAAFALLVEVLSEYNAGDSRSIPRLQEAWDQRRGEDMYRDGGGSSGGYGAGGPSPDRGRYGGYSDSRYEPYPRSGGGRMHHGGGGGDNEVGATNMVVMPNAVNVPNIPGGMPTVLIQQADGSLVQVRRRAAVPVMFLYTRKGSDRGKGAVVPVIDGQSCPSTSLVEQVRIVLSFRAAELLRPGVPVLMCWTSS